MLHKKTLFFSLNICFLASLFVLKADDTRLLVVSLALPPKNLLAAIDGPVISTKAIDKIEKFGTLSPDKFAKKMLKGLVPSTVVPSSPSGIMMIYGGYVSYTDFNGLVNFPLRHEGKQIDIVFTPSIDLQRLYKDTYSGIFISQKSISELKFAASILPEKYSFTQKPLEEKNPGASLEKKSEPSGIVMGNWAVSKSTVGMDTLLPPESVIVLVNPKNVFVPLGNATAMVQPHTVLPDMYLVGKEFNDEILLENQTYAKNFEKINVQTASSVNKNITIEQSAIINQ